ncbi:MAG: hypothetical protein AMXMBFR84_26000 [Candidatus Hydrogenedentota bacterium]
MVKKAGWLAKVRALFGLKSQAMADYQAVREMWNTYEVPIENSIAKNLIKGLKAFVLSAGSIGAILGVAAMFGLVQLTPEEITVVVDALKTIATELIGSIAVITTAIASIVAVFDAAKKRTEKVRTEKPPA